nr:hypothetical protein [Bartonella washoeensis]
MPPAATDVPPAATDVPPAATDVPSVATDVPPAATDVVPAATDVAPAATDAAPAATDVPPAATDVPPAATDVAPAATDVPSVATDVPPAAATDVPPAATDVVPAATDVAPAATDVAPAATDVAPAATDAAPAATDAAPAAKGAVSATLDANFSFQSLIQDQEFILENQESLFKDYDLDKLLHKIRTVLEHNDLESVKKQFHRLFDKENSVIYSCPADYTTLDENFKIAKEGIGQRHLTRDGHNSVVDGKSYENVENHNRDSRFEGMYDRLQETGERLKAVHNSLKEKESRLENDSFWEKKHEESNHAGLQRSEEDSLLSPKTSSLPSKTPLFSPKALYKKGYDFILSGNYVKAEKAFCAFQSRYQKDALSDDALFWLAEALLGQKRYHEAAQVYLNVWYLDTKKLYTSEILLKLAISMVAFGHNEEACTLFAKRPKSSKTPKLSKTLECVFCKSLKKERSHARCSLD